MSDFRELVELAQVFPYPAPLKGRVISSAEETEFLLAKLRDAANEIDVLDAQHEALRNKLRDLMALCVLLFLMLVTVALWRS